MPPNDVVSARWKMEEGFAQVMGEVGLDQDEVRIGEAWHRHATLCLLTHASLVVLWRAIPQQYGTWETAYQRYRLWCTTGLWPRILAALAQCGSKVSL